MKVLGLRFGVGEVSGRLFSRPVEALGHECPSCVGHRIAYMEGGSQTDLGDNKKLRGVPSRDPIGVRLKNSHATVASPYEACQWPLLR